ncbi:MAG: 2-oxo acid dehydrogenase subunit E2, partial [Planctomycetes bacterium]|nr:2-oxo acid dehydrogenase subunit E2 [Planctomycetota bacterium]
IIPLGQSSILAAGRAAPRPWAVGDALAVRTTIALCLSADHRVLDGQPAADYLGRIVDLIEHPACLL